MKEQLLDVVRGVERPGAAVNLAREYLQARILLALQEAGAMIPLAFQGGTALRFLFGLPRFSEDLDFALERPERADFDLARLGDRVALQLKREGYETAIKQRTDRAVQSTMVTFPGLLYEAALSPHESQRLNIRIEVDTNPPAGAGLETTIVRRHVLLNLQHYDHASLLAGKLHALQQTGWDHPPLECGDWRNVVRERVEAVDWDAAERDVAPFLEPGPDSRQFGRDSLLQVLSSG